MFSKKHCEYAAKKLGLPNDIEIITSGISVSVIDEAEVLETLGFEGDEEQETSTLTNWQILSAITDAENNMRLPKGWVFVGIKQPGAKKLKYEIVDFSEFEVGE
jgi:hypothetical protein